MTTQQDIRFLIHLSQEQRSAIAINKLWEFYLPLVQEIVLAEIVRYGLEDDAEDIINESYFVFREVVLNYDLSKQFFNSYLRRNTQKRLSNLAYNNFIKPDKMIE